MNTYFKTVSAVVLKESIIPIKRRPSSSCIEAGKILFSNGVLVRSVSPIKNVRGVRHICDVCEKPLASKQVLEDHKKAKHTSVHKKIRCTVCYNLISVDKMSNLTKHYGYHSLPAPSDLEILLVDESLTYGDENDVGLTLDEAVERAEEDVETSVDSVDEDDNIVDCDIEISNEEAIQMSSILKKNFQERRSSFKRQIDMAFSVSPVRYPN